MKKILFNKKIDIDKNTKCNIDNNILNVKGVLGSINFKFNKFLNVNIDNNFIYINSTNKNRINFKSLINTSISIIKNMFIGVNIGFLKKLILFGVGYKFFIDNKYLFLSLGYSKDIKYKIPENISLIYINSNEIIVKGIDKQLVGQTAYNIRKFKIPDIYKGKGIRYYNEKIKFKVSKKTNK